MNIAIVDDSREDMIALEEILKKYSKASGVEFCIRRFSNAEELLSGYKPYFYTAIFLDIYLDKMTGTEAAEKIRKEDSDTFIIFLTTSREHRAEAFRTHAYDYIEKPVSIAEIFRVMDDMLKKKSVRQPGLTFLCNRKQETVTFRDIVLVSSSLHNVEIRDARGNIYRPRISFSSVSEELLSDRQFLLISRGAIVNMNYVENFDQGICFLKGNVRIPCNLRREKELINTWQNYIFTVIRGEAMERMREKKK